jgi:hypothetical protein
MGSIVKVCTRGDVSQRHSGHHQPTSRVTHHSRLAVMRRLILGIVWDARCWVEQAIDAVATVRPVDAAAVRVGNFFDGSSKVSEEAVISEDQLPMDSTRLQARSLTFQA